MSLQQVLRQLQTTIMPGAPCPCAYFLHIGMAQAVAILEYFLIVPPFLVCVLRQVHNHVASVYISVADDH